VSAIANRFLGLAAMGSATFLTLRDQSAQIALWQTQVELDQASRVTTMGHLTASIAQEVIQPMSAIVADADAALNWVQRQPPDLEEARQSLTYINQNGRRAAEIVGRIRDLLKKGRHGRIGWRSTQ
jgi:phosphoglycerate-specific signal transduction histidine kinase